MLTIDRWREFAVTPKTLQFPRLELLGHDHAPSIIVGVGKIQLDSPEVFNFTLSGTPADAGYAFSEIRRRQSNRYDPLARFRLLGCDDRGIRWNGGWTSPVLSIKGNSWTFTGEIEGLITDVEGAAVSSSAALS